MKTTLKHNVIVITTLFLLTGGLVVLAHLRAPVDYPIDEPSELTQKRRDMQNNALYILQDALKRLPEKPQPLRLCDEKTIPYGYQPEVGSIGQLLEVQRPDDDAQMVEYIHKCRPALDLAVSALNKPWFLTERALEDFMERRKRKRELYLLPALLLAQASLQECSEDPNQDACQSVLNGLDLMRILNNDGTTSCFMNTRLASQVVTKARADHLPLLAEGFDRIRAGWTPPDQGVDADLRNVYASRVLDSDYEGKNKLLMIAARYSRASHKRQMFAVDKSIRKAAGLTLADLLSPTVPPELLDDNVLGFTSLFAVMNSKFFTALDGLRLSVALEQFNRSTGAYPEALASLVPQYLPNLPRNAFNGGNYVYERKGNWYLLHADCRHPRFPTFLKTFIIHLPPGVSEKALRTED